MDFSLKLTSCLKIMLMTRDASSSETKIDAYEVLVALLMSETIGIIVPLAYAACLVTAWHGPNAEVLGNVQNSYWQYHEVVDLSDSVTSLLIFWGVEAVSLLITSTVLYFTRGIDTFKAYCHTATEYGFLMAVQLAFAIESQFRVVAIGCAFDMTFVFSWVRK